MAIFALTAAWFLAAVWWRTGALPHFWMTALLFGAFLIALLCFIADAARAATQATDFQPARYNRWYWYVAFWLAGMVVGVVPLSLAKAYAPSGWFDVASSSMEPTLHQGKSFLADSSYYRNHQPSRGDVAIYALVSDHNTAYVKRIAAVAGDRIAVRSGVALVNGQPASEPYIRILDAHSAYNNTGEVTVPAGHVFMLGDNRSNSLDSRVQSHGMIPVANLRARVTEIGYSHEFGRLGLWVGNPR